MDDLRFIEMFGEIDEKIVQEANGDLNFWQETREGVVVCVGNSRRSPLRIVFAYVACAVVVFGAVFFMRNFLKNGFTYVPGGPGGSFVQSEENSNREDIYAINSDVMWAIGKTFDEVTERYGEVAGGNIFEYSFENGYGVYVWDVTDHSHSDLNENISLARESGGCKAIANISAGDLLTGDLSMVNLDNIAQRYGFDVVPLNPSPEGFSLYDDYIFAYYTHPSYENLTFIMCYKKSGFDEEATFHIRYDKNSV